MSPVKPPMSIANRVKLITPECFDIKVLYGSFLKYSHKDFMTIQMNRIGFSGKSESFNEPVLTVYGMMMTGLVTVADGTSQSTHIYTLNPNLAKMMCGNTTVESVIGDIKEQPINVKKISIMCLEIIPQRAKSTWVYDCQPALFECKKKQTVTYTLSILCIRNRMISQLRSNILDIQFFDLKLQAVRDISTTLSRDALSAIMDENVYSKVARGVIDEKKMATLKLPVIGSDNSGFAEVFIPSIIGYTYRPAGLIVGNKFAPSAKKGNKSK
ncbi:MAG: hypothetical protein NC253_01655 [Ruminococcus sp.]|nr:hypothetical protein [Ruminococcus sp.]MCM1380740.1 hypothetical protein [Muribaculaceae bacterium]MCM1478864.1 hypothetical protein [Muribaculaceae bacterium]